MISQLKQGIATPGQQQVAAGDLEILTELNANQAKTIQKLQQEADLSDKAFDIVQAKFEKAEAWVDEWKTILELHGYEICDKCGQVGDLEGHACTPKDKL